MLFNNSSNGTFSDNIILSTTSDDYNFGGVTLYSNTSKVNVLDNHFYSLSPGVMNESNKNIIGYNSYH